jgi:hypothetical protein
MCVAWVVNRYRNVVDIWVVLGRVERVRSAGGRERMIWRRSPGGRVVRLVGILGFRMK